MKSRRTAETDVADKLLQTGAVKLQPDNPFTWAAGWKSPIYCDNRQVLSYPFVRDTLKSELCNLIFESFPEANVVAGVATAGIPWGAMAADQLKLPFIYVRPKPKDHGLGNQVEGKFTPGDKIVVVEDLISTGMSSLKVCDVLKESGAVVVGMVAIFTYAFPQSEDAFKKAGVKLLALTNYESLIHLAIQKGIIKQEQLEILLNWRTSPETWNRD